MKSFSYTVTTPSGFDSTHAAMLCKEAQKYKTTIMLHLGDRARNAKSLLNTMSLGIRCGDTIKITCDGEGEAVAAFALEKFCKASL